MTLFVPPTASADKISLDLGERVREVRETAKIVDRTHAALPWVVLGLLLASVAVNRNRRRAVLAVGIGVVTTAVIMLLVLKGIRPEVVGLASGTANQNAVGAVWDQVTAALYGRIWWLLLPGVALMLFAMVAGPYGWARSFRASIGLPKLATSRAAGAWDRFRGGVDRGRRWIQAGGVVLAAVILLALPAVTIAGVAGTTGIFIAWLSLVELIRKPA